ncbi:MAG: hypothetical protein IKS18_07765 [Lachnospiraceae bacterium]|nr:hypothetical protein [Lachnospiraceae bacterium]
MKIDPMTPRYLNETVLNLCIIIGAILGTVGLVFLIIRRFADKDAWICTALGVLICVVFIRVKLIQAEHEKVQPKKDADEHL